MYFYKKNQWQWLLYGALSANLALAPALMNSAHAQSSATGQQTPAPGQQGDWGQAGPPPDVQNGQIPSQDSANQTQNADPNADQGPAQYPGQATDANQAPAPAPGGYQQQSRPAYQPQQNSQARGNAYQAPAAPPSGPVTLNSGLLLTVRTSEPLDSKRLKAGDYFQGTVAQSVWSGNVVAIPRGAQVTGRVVDVKKAGELKGGANVALQLTSVNLGGNSYPLATDVFNTGGPGKGGYTASNTVGTAALGAVIGAIAGGGPGAAIGAAAGTGVGLGASAATPGPRSVVPPEAMVSFHLTSPATVQPLPAQEVQQVEASSAPARPQNRGYPRAYAYGPGGYPVGPPPPAYGYAPYPYPYRYGYPYGYYRPYPYGRAYYYGR